MKVKSKWFKSIDIYWGFLVTRKTRGWGFQFSFGNTHFIIGWEA